MHERASRSPSQKHANGATINVAKLAKKVVPLSKINLYLLAQMNTTTAATQNSRESSEDRESRFNQSQNGNNISKQRSDSGFD